ncbi:hypothetical protein D3C87_1494750 [compost metagenome]
MCSTMYRQGSQRAKCCIASRFRTGIRPLTSMCSTMFSQVSRRAICCIASRFCTGIRSLTGMSSQMSCKGVLTRKDFATSGTGRTIWFAKKTHRRRAGNRRTGRLNRNGIKSPGYRNVEVKLCLRVRCSNIFIQVPFQPLCNEVIVGDFQQGQGGGKCGV